MRIIHFVIPSGLTGSPVQRRFALDGVVQAAREMRFRIFNGLESSSHRRREPNQHTKDDEDE
jgi:hypothetical protein